jgi:uncharacterized protein
MLPGPPAMLPGPPAMLPGPPAMLPGPPAMLPGVDHAAVAAAFGLRLRSAGVAIGLSEIEVFTAALGTRHPTSLTDLYWTARVTLVRRPADLALFDAVFAHVFGAAPIPLGPAARLRRGPTPPPPPGPAGRHSPAPVAAGDDTLPWATLAPGAGRAGGEDGAGSGVPERLPSALAAVADVPFDAFDASLLESLDRWLTDALRSWPTRPARRLVVDPRGRRVSLRRTMAAGRRQAFEPAHLVRTGPVRRRRRLVLVCDVSRSMEPYAAAYLHLARAAATVAGAEVFAFATDLTRLTAVLLATSPDAALERATAAVADRFGGTRIAHNIDALLASRHGESVRGAVVVVASDGWDSGAPEALGRATARLRRRAHRLLWLNPRAAAPDFTPGTGGMAAALPNCDAVLPAHTVAAMADVVAALCRP